MTQAQVAPSDMPQLFLAADTASVEAQRQYIRWTRGRLILVVAAAAAGITSWRVGKGEIDILAVLAVVLFVGALLIEGMLWRTRPESTWYDGRAVAESAKTLAWKFAVCADPFPSEMTKQAAVSRLIERLDAVSAQYQQLQLAPVDAPMVTGWMTSQRDRPWLDRQQVYVKQRLREQRNWYSKNATRNRRRSTQWRAALVVLEFAGLTLALSEALTPGMLTMSSTVAACVGAVVAWLETRQFDFNARAYSAAVSDLAKAEAKLQISADEATWALEVNDAEDAISREHTLWLGSRSQI